MKKVILFLLVFFAYSHLFSQDLTYDVTFFIHQKDAFLKIDNQPAIDLSKYPRPYVTKLTEGTHVIQIWAPIYELFIDTLVVKKDKVNRYAKGLIKQAETYKNYREQLSDYKRTRFKILITQIGFTSINAALLWYSLDGAEINTIQKLETEIEEARENYNSAFNPIRVKTFRAEFEELRTEHTKQKQRLYLKRYIGIPLVAASSYFTYKYLKKLSKNKPVEPIYQPKNPFTLTQLGLGYDNQSSFSLNLNFEF